MPYVESLKTGERLAAQQAGEVVVELLEYDVNGNLIYKGATNDYAANLETNTWYIYKNTYDGDGNLVRRELRQWVAWVDRALLGWIS